MPHRFAPLLVALVVALAATPPAAPAAPEYTGPYFEDRAAELGITFHHAGNDGSGDFRSVTSGAACWGDFDGDGYEDLYFTNTLYDEASRNAEMDPHAELYRNDGDGGFTRIDGSGAEHRGWGNGCAVADHDADGDLDIFVAGFGENALYRNDGGFRFTNVTLAANVSAIGRCSAGYACWGQGAAFADYDGDGCLDLYVANYVRYDPTDWRGNGPSLYEGQENFLFRNRCDGTFEDVTDEAGVGGAPSLTSDKSLHASWGDYDGDGRPDIVVANDECPLHLYRNNGDGTFAEVAGAAGVRDERGNMGVAFDDVNGDGHLDLYITHYLGEQNGFYLNRGDGTFEDRSGSGGLRGDDAYVGWGTGFIDYDNDGYMDIYVVNGHTVDVGDYAQPRQMFRNDGTNDGWVDVSTDLGPGFSDKSVGRGSAVADYVYDGTLAIAVSNTGDRPANFLVERRVTHGWLDVELRAPLPNRFAVGAEITVRPEGLPPVTQVVRSGTSYDSQDGFVKHFGLGAAPHADVTVRWPDGARETWHDVPTRQVVRLTQGEPQIVNDTLAPRSTATTSPPAFRGWHQDDVQVVIEAADRGATQPSGVASTSWRVDGGAWQSGLPPVTLSGFTPGRHLLEYYSTDAAGNVEPIRALEVAVDADQPSSGVGLVDTVAGWVTSRSTVALRATDGTSGVHAIHYSIGDGALARYSEPLRFAGEGEVLLRHYAEDVSGRFENSRSVRIPVDTVPPRSELDARGPILRIGDRDHVTSATRLLVRATDGASGVAASEYRLPGGTWARVPDEGIAIEGPDGPLELEYRSVDVAGNVEGARLALLVLDNHTPPPLRVAEPRKSTVYTMDFSWNLTFADPAWAHVAPVSRWERPIVIVGTIPLEATAGRDVSGVLWTRVSVDGRLLASATGSKVSHAWTSGEERAGWHRLSFETSDGLGNVREVARWVLVLPATHAGAWATATGGPKGPPE